MAGGVRMTYKICQDDLDGLIAESNGGEGNEIYTSNSQRFGIIQNEMGKYIVNAGSGVVLFCEKFEMVKVTKKRWEMRLFSSIYTGDFFGKIQLEVI
jgi:hypothetical protein